MKLPVCFFGSVGVTFLCNLTGPWSILMRSVILIQGLVLWPGVRIVSGRERGLVLRVMWRVYGRTRFRVVVAELGMTGLIRASRHIFMGVVIMHLMVVGHGYRFASW